MSKEIIFKAFCATRPHTVPWIIIQKNLSPPSKVRRIHSLWHRWSSGRIRPCHGRDPGSIPGRCSKTTNVRPYFFSSEIHHPVWVVGISCWRLFFLKLETAAMLIRVQDDSPNGRLEVAASLAAKVGPRGKKPLHWHQELEPPWPCLSRRNLQVGTVSNWNYHIEVSLSIKSK